MVVQRIPHRVGAVSVGQFDMSNLALGMDTGIGSARYDTGDGLTSVEMRGGFFQHLLDRQAVDLTLPANKWGAVVFN